MATPLLRLCALLPVSLLAACQPAPTREAPASNIPLLAPGEPGVLVDGDTSEWPAQLAAWSDEHYLYLRFTIENEQLTLQSSGRTVSILLDTDASASTGLVPPRTGLSDLGADVEIQFSPRKASGGTSSGAAILVHSDGSTRRFKADALDLAVAPTYASSWYEARLTRTPKMSLGLPPNGLLAPGRVRGAVAVLDDAGVPEAWTDPFEIQTEDICPGGERLSDFAPPAKPADAIRVMTLNVEKGAPMSNPEPFRRILRALSPDVVLVQEWDGGEADVLRTWFSALGTEGEWHIATAGGTTASGGGVAIASRFRLTQLPGKLMTNEGSGPRPVRFVGAVAESPAGPMVIGTAHLKCCGTSGSSEDQRRMTEARAVSAALRAAAGAYPAAIRVVGGDLNLVGSRPPLDLLRAELDADGSDLSVAAPQVLGDVTLTTWRSPGSDFPPGRLDYLAYSDANADVVSSFVFDTARFTAEALGQMGLERSDSAATDHLPVVIDLKPR
ncbi:MAG: endonuclease/exonuclease/phosphatase family protein [Leptolyngbya sp. PLA1]|nr:endonuclease/exonuclease/phosphatase family protein [Leptolyngbya sp. PLA1]